VDVLPRRWSPIARRFAPFAAVGLVAILVAILPPAPTSWAPIVAAGVLTVLLAAVGVLVPWERLPRWTFLVPTLSYLVVVALLRESSGGAPSGYSVLALLPVVWVALTLGRRELSIVLAGVAGLFLVPLLAVGGENYPPSEWRRAALSTLVAAIVGFSVQNLVSQRRAQADRAEQRARALAESEATIAAVAKIVRADRSAEDARAAICDSVLEATGAILATIVEPDGTGRLAITASAGAALPAVSLDEGDLSPSGSVVAFRSGKPHVVFDAQHDPAVVRSVAAVVPIESVVYEPILADGRPIGVLSAAWTAPFDAVAPSARTAVSLLAVEAARAIERAELYARLEQHARTDELTGLPNRRTWERRLPELVAEAATRVEPLCVAVVDLDRFKAYNDTHGHQSGDDLLQRAAHAWLDCLRREDLLARYGGEEFALALPGCRLDDAERIIERLRSQTPLGQTCSAGLAQLMTGETAEEVIRRADEALYAAKRRGRDRLVLAPAA
jgi:diguanylate cyclase (GGDEF)-like protein